VTADDKITVFSQKPGDDATETPFAAIAVRGGFATIGLTIHHARLYRIEGRKPVYAMLRVFSHDLLPYRRDDLFSVPLALHTISVRCAWSKLRAALAEEAATYLGWVVVGDELEVPMESFTGGHIGGFRKEFPNITRWRIRGLESATVVKLRPNVLAAEGITEAAGDVAKIVGKAWRPSANVLFSTHPTVVRRDALGRVRHSSAAGLPTTWTVR